MDIGRATLYVSCMLCITGWTCQGFSPIWKGDSCESYQKLLTTLTNIVMSPVMLKRDGFIKGHFFYIYLEVREEKCQLNQGLTNICFLELVVLPPAFALYVKLQGKYVTHLSLNGKCKATKVTIVQSVSVPKWQSDSDNCLSVWKVLCQRANDDKESVYRT